MWPPRTGPRELLVEMERVPDPVKALFGDVSDRLVTTRARGLLLSLLACPSSGVRRLHHTIRGGRPVKKKEKKKKSRILVPSSSLLPPSAMPAS